MKKFLTKYYVIFILVLLFSAPGIFAWYFFNHPGLLGDSFTNKGQLLQPPIAMESFQDLRPNLKKSTKWRLVFWTQTACSSTCMQQLEKLAKIRLALGRKLYEVDLDFFQAKEAPLPSKTLMDKIEALGFHRTTLQSPAENIPPVLIANPDNYLILGFKKDSNSADIFHDLKLLISNPNTASSLNTGAKH